MTFRPSPTTRPGRWATRPRKVARARSKTLDFRNEVAKVGETESPGIDQPDKVEEGGGRPADDWDENEPSPHQGEEGQQESEA
jgi:hypothetical protein